MKRNIATIAIGLSLAVSSVRGNQLLDFHELGGEGHFAVLLNNNPWPHAHISITVFPDGEHYEIALDEGYSFIQELFPVEIDEPGSPPVFDSQGNKIGIKTNFIGFADENTLLWDSEGETSANPSHNNPSIVTNGVMGPNNVMFDVRLIDVPESSSTLSLLGIGLAGLAWFARSRRRVKDCRF